MADPPVRFGLIGFGAWGRCRAGAITRTNGAELAAIAARSPETCAAEVYEDYRELLRRPDLELIDIVVPSRLHR